MGHLFGGVAVALKRAAVDPVEIGFVLVSHLHGDHFGGIPFLILDGQFSQRTRPLVIAGPPGLTARVHEAMEVLFPGSASVNRRFSVEFVEFTDRVSITVGPATVTPFTVDHACGDPPFALRIAYGARTIVYSGDTAWTDTLVEAVKGASLLVCESYFFDKKVRYHLDYTTLKAHRHRLECARIILTHMSGDMLRRCYDAEFECADDSMVVVVE